MEVQPAKFFVKIRSKNSTSNHEFSSFKEIEGLFIDTTIQELHHKKTHKYLISKLPQRKRLIKMPSASMDIAVPLNQGIKKIHLFNIASWKLLSVIEKYKFSEHREKGDDKYIINRFNIKNYFKSKNITQNIVSNCNSELIPIVVFNDGRVWVATEHIICDHDSSFNSCQKRSLVNKGERGEDDEDDEDYEGSEDGEDGKEGKDGGRSVADKKNMELAVKYNGAYQVKKRKTVEKYPSFLSFSFDEEKKSSLYFSINSPQELNIRSTDNIDISLAIGQNDTINFSSANFTIATKEKSYPLSLSRISEMKDQKSAFKFYVDNDLLGLNAGEIIRESGENSGENSSEKRSIYTFGRNDIDPNNKKLSREILELDTVTGNVKNLKERPLFFHKIRDLKMQGERMSLVLNKSENFDISFTTSAQAETDTDDTEGED